MSVKGVCWEAVILTEILYEEDHSPFKSVTHKKKDSFLPLFVQFFVFFFALF